MYRPRPTGHNGLIHECREPGLEVIPEFSPTVDESWKSPSVGDGPKRRTAIRALAVGRMVRQGGDRMRSLLARLVTMNDGWAKPFGDFNHRWVSALFRPIRPIKDFLNGTWLAHPVHPAATDLPIGVLLVAALLIYEHQLIRPEDLTRVNQAFFQVNVVISVGLLAIGLLDLWLC